MAVSAVVSPEDVRRLSEELAEPPPSRHERRLARIRAHVLLDVALGWRHRVALGVQVVGWLAVVGGTLASTAGVAVVAWRQTGGDVSLPALAALVNPLVWYLGTVLATFVAGVLMLEGAARWRRLRALTITAIGAGLDDDVIVSWLIHNRRDEEQAAEVLAAVVDLHTRGQ